MRIKIVQEIIDKIRNKRRENRIYTVPNEKNTSFFENLIYVKGFGYSGSGAILDFLSEFNNTTVYGYKDVEFSGDKGSTTRELLLMRVPGCVYDLENMFLENCYLDHDFAIKLFLHSSEALYRKGGIYNDEYWKLTNEFVENIVDYKYYRKKAFVNKILRLKTYWKRYDNLKSELLYQNNNYENLEYWLKHLSVKEYRKFANEYINAFLKTIPSKENLVLDQIFRHKKVPVDVIHDYLGKVKIVCSWRDPRDVYVTAVEQNIPCIPHTDVETFCKWFRDREIAFYLNEKHPDLLMIKFDDLVLNYDKTTKEIMNFLGLKEENHIAPKTNFNPEVSKVNVGSWKSFADQKAMTQIGEELSEYCYNKG